MKKKSEPESRFTDESEPVGWSPITDEDIALVERVTGRKPEVPDHLRATPHKKHTEAIPAE